MKNITKLQKIAPYLYFTWLILSVFAITFFDAAKTFYPTAIWSASIVILFAFWILCPNKKWRVISSYKMIFISMALFSLFVYIRFLMQPYAYFGFNTLIIGSTLFFVLFTAATIDIRKIHLRLIFRLFCAFTFLLCLYGLYLYIFAPFARITGPFFIEEQLKYFPNAFSFLILGIIPIQVVYLFNQVENVRWTLVKYYFYISSIVIFTTFFLIFSRSSLISLFTLSIVFIVIFLTSAFKNKPFYSGKVIKNLLVVIILSFVLITVVNWSRGLNFEYGSFQENLAFGASESTVPFFDRFDNMSVAIELIQQYPVFGVGANNFEYFYPKYQNSTFTSTHAYNFVLHNASETGIITTILLIIFIVYLVYYYFKNFKKIEQKYYIGMLGFIILSAAVENIIDYNFNFLVNDTVFGLMMAIVISRFLTVKSKNESKWKVLVFSYVSLIVLIVSTVTIHEVYFYGNVVKAKELQQEGDFLEASKYYNLAADKLWFKEDFAIRASNMYKYQNQIERLGDEQLKQWLNSAEKSTQINLYYEESYHSYANAMCKNNMYTEAYTTFVKSIMMDSQRHYEIYYDLAKCMYENGELDEEAVKYIKNRHIWYNNSLKENPYFFHTSDNHEYIEKIYILLIEEAKYDDEEFLDAYEEFKSLKNENINYVLGGQERT